MTTPNMNHKLTRFADLSHRLRPILKRVPGLRSAWYLSSHLRDMLSYRTARSRNDLDQLFEETTDPWQFDEPMEQARYHRELSMIIDAHGPNRIGRAMEIGCAEAMFTRNLAGYCDSLLAVDLSPVALLRAQQRCAHLPQVRCAEFDVRSDTPPGTFALIIASCVLEYIVWPATMRRVRSRLVSSIAPGGLLLVSNTAGNDVLDHAWWGRVLIRGGKWISYFFGTHPALEIVAEEETAHHLDTLFQKRR